MGRAGDSISKRMLNSEVLTNGMISSNCDEPDCICHRVVLWFQVVDGFHAFLKLVHGDQFVKWCIPNVSTVHYRRPISKRIDSVIYAA